jgi:hypothetical protein
MILLFPMRIRIPDFTNRTGAPPEAFEMIAPIKKSDVLFSMTLNAVLATAHSGKER